MRCDDLLDPSPRSGMHAQVASANIAYKLDTKPCDLHDTIRYTLSVFRASEGT